ncbi:MAG TPA: MXAN_2561 family MXYO-CTERM-anchored protein [Myxococcaceae bacterium]|jgi:hypothetical protein
MSLRPSLSLQRAAIALAALVTAGRAGAQSVTLDVNQKQAVLLAKNDCNLTLNANWSINAAGATACDALTIWATTATSCANAPVAGDLEIGIVPQASWVTQATGSFQFKVSDLPLFTSAATCPQDMKNDVMRVCAFTKYSPLGGNCVEAKASQPPTLTYDTTPPEPPVITSVVPQDSALQINFTAKSDVSTVAVAYQSAIGPYTEGPEGPAASGSIRLEGLTNGITYAVLLRAKDAAENESTASNVLNGTPVLSFGFFASYKNSHGDTEGGCAAAPASACPLLALGWLARRRRQARGGVRG